MSASDYNYSVFTGEHEDFLGFAQYAPKVTMRAPSFPLENLTSGETVQMQDLWKRDVSIIEFGSFT